MKLKRIAITLLSVCLVGVGHAAEEKGELETIYVSAQDNSSFKGKHRFSTQDLKQRISANNNVSDILSHQRSVRTALGRSNGATQGEITPQNLSFYGERYYNNNFMLNGISINDNINPIGLGKSGILERDKTLTVSYDQLPSGNPQVFWISPELLESLDIYDSNVPSQFGHFTGAAINAKLKEADTQRFSGALTYRTTRDRWTKQHFDGDYIEEFEKAYSPLTQPKFIKNQYNFYVNQPISENSALLFSYDRQQSRIPQQQRYLERWVKQKRLAETFLISYHNEINKDNLVNATVLYSPHSGSYFLDNAKNGRFVERGGGWFSELSWKNYNKLGLLTTTLSYRDNKNRTDYDSNILYRYTKTDSINWISDPGTEEATEGGIGKRFTRQQQLQFKQNLELDLQQFGASEHIFSLGWEFQRNDSSIKQKDLAVILSGASKLECREDSAFPDGVCEPFILSECTYCVPGEQYFTAKSLIYPVNAKVNHNRAAFYVQDKIKWNYLTFIPGIRADYTQFTKRIDIAPRFFFGYDLFGLNQTYLNAGLNRYYAGDLVDYKLRSAYKFQDNYIRKPYENGWELSEQTNSVRYPDGKKLKTPYSDEINFGISQKIANTLWEIKWLQRRSKDQLMTQTDDKSKPYQSWLVNEGRGKTNNFNLEVKAVKPLKTAWADVNWQLGVSYQKSKSNQTTDYTQSSWRSYGIDKVLVKNKLHPITDVPALDFNTPWKAYAKLSLYFPYINLNWIHQLNYESSTESGTLSPLRCSEKIAACGHYRGIVARYNYTKYKRNLTLDWLFDWRLPLSQYQALSVNLTVLNVLDRVAKAERVTENYGESYYQTYQPGRQFWLGIKYEW